MGPKTQNYFLPWARVFLLLLLGDRLLSTAWGWASTADLRHCYATPFTPQNSQLPNEEITSYRLSDRLPKRFLELPEEDSQPFRVVCGGLSSFEVKYNRSQRNTIQCMPDSGVCFPSSNSVFSVPGFFSPWKTPKPVSWNPYASFFISIYFSCLINKTGNWMTFNAPPALRLISRISEEQTLCTFLPFLVLKYRDRSSCFL